jgi:hypothetical protein
MMIQLERARDEREVERDDRVVEVEERRRRIDFSPRTEHHTPSEKQDSTTESASRAQFNPIILAFKPKTSSLRYLKSYYGCIFRRPDKKKLRAIFLTGPLQALLSRIAEKEVR